MKTKRQRAGWGINIPIHKGEAHRLSRLTEKDVLDIRARADEDWDVLAKEKGITRGYVGRIIRKTRWKHV